MVHITVIRLDDLNLGSETILFNNRREAYNYINNRDFYLDKSIYLEKIDDLYGLDEIQKRLEEELNKKSNLAIQEEYADDDDEERFVIKIESIEVL